MAEGTAEETEEGVKDKGAVSPSAGLLRREGMAVEEVVEVGDCWGWADRLQGWVARRMRREERREEEKEKEVIGILSLLLSIAVGEERGSRSRRRKPSSGSKSASMV